MDLNTIEHVVRPQRREDVPAFQDGDAYLAGGTWLFSEPQTALRRLVDLPALGWPALERDEAGLLVAATCTLAELEVYSTALECRAAVIIRQCCQALLGSLKIRRLATVGGNLCLALPASPMAALVVALDGLCTIWMPEGAQRQLPATALIEGATRTALGRGEILRSVLLSDAALRRRVAFRQMSLTPMGRSAALVIGTREGLHIVLTITASVAHPVQVKFAMPPDAATLHATIDDAIPLWYDDVHGAPEWRRRITHLMSAEICDELTL